MKIADITAYALSFPVSAKGAVSLGIGRKVKRDTVVVKVTTDEGLIGFGEAHHGRAPGAIARLINTTCASLLLGRDACDVIATWRTV
jgi:D-galactarolactone cycloisomerase